MHVDVQQIIYTQSITGRWQSGYRPSNLKEKNWPSTLIFLNMNLRGFCSRPPVAVYPITCIYVNDLAEGSSSDQALETLSQKGKSFHRFEQIYHFIYPLWSDKGTDDMYLFSLLQIQNSSNLFRVLVIVKSGKMKHYFKKKYYHFITNYLS